MQHVNANCGSSIAKKYIQLQKCNTDEISRNDDGEDVRTATMVILTNLTMVYVFSLVR